MEGVHDRCGASHLISPQGLDSSAALDIAKLLQSVARSMKVSFVATQYQVCDVV